VPQRSLFDLEQEDDEFLRNFNQPINAVRFEGTEEEEKGDAVDAPNYVSMEVGMKRGTDGELRRAIVRRRLMDEDGRPIGVGHNNPLVDTRRYEVQYDDGSTEALSANMLAANILSQVDEHGYRHRMMEEIGGHRRSKDAIDKSEAFFTTVKGTIRRKPTTKGWQIYVIWKDGSSNYIPLREMKDSFPLETAKYAIDADIADEPAFAWWVPHVIKKQERFINKVKSKYWERTHKYGVRIPKTIQEAIEIDKANGNILWQDAVRMEMKNNRVAFEEYEGDISKLVGYKRITGHMIFDVKLGENFRRKARFVADGHLTDAPAALTYSTVVSRDSVRILLMIAALNDLDLQCADIQNAFLTAPNLEKCYMIAGPEFLDEQGKVFVVRRALYGLKSSAQAFRSFLADNVESLGFFSSEADPDVWMRTAVKSDGEEYYEYILCYVDDILCMSGKALEVMQQLQTKFKFKKDLIEPPESYLGAKLKKKIIDGDAMWAISSVDYVQAAIKTIEGSIEDKQWKLPRSAPTPMLTSYEPELDGTPELNDDDHRFYQELIGILRWATELGRVDILLEVSLLSQYQACPRQGHMEQALRIVAFLKNNNKMSLYMNWRLPNIDQSSMQYTAQDFKGIYRDAEEELPPRMPKPRGRGVETLAYVDASHAANKKTRRSHTGYVIFVNSAPVLWHSKKQNTVEASTFGSEFIALKACIEAITHLRYKLRMFGIPLEGKPTHIFCDNESVVTNASKVESTLNKKHNSIAYHYARWNTAAGVIQVSWLNGIDNIADAFTKRLAQARREHLFGEWTF